MSAGGYKPKRPGVGRALIYIYRGFQFLTRRKYASKIDQPMFKSMSFIDVDLLLQRCAEGMVWDVNSESRGCVEPCVCHGHAEECDQEARCRVGIIHTPLPVSEKKSLKKRLF